MTGSRACASCASTATRAASGIRAPSPSYRPPLTSPPFTPSRPSPLFPSHPAPGHLSPLPPLPPPPNPPSWLARLLLSEAEAALARSDAAARGGEGGSLGSQQTSLAQANHLRFLEPLLVELGWRGLPLLRALLRSELMRRWVTHPYKQVREECGVVLCLAMEAAALPPAAHPALGAQLAAEVTDLVTHLRVACRVPDIASVPQPPAAAAATAAAAPPNALASTVSISSISAIELLEPAAEEEREAARAAREAVLAALNHCMLAGRAHACVAQLPTLLPAVLSAAASQHKPDLANSAKTCAVLLAQAPLSALLLGELLDQLHSLAASPAWHLRGSLLLPLQLLVYRGQVQQPSVVSVLLLAYCGQVYYTQRRPCYAPAAPAAPAAPRLGTRRTRRTRCPPPPPPPCARLSSCSRRRSTRRRRASCCSGCYATRSSRCARPLTVHTVLTMLTMLTMLTYHAYHAY